MSAEEGRIVRVGSADKRFASMEALEEEIEARKRVLRVIETEDFSKDPRNASTWAVMAHNLGLLSDLTNGLEKWIRDEEHALDQEIEKVRASIRAVLGNHPRS